MKLIADNRKARFDYQILETLEAGLMLMGSEVKAIRSGQVNLKDSYIIIKSSEAYLQSAYISEYKASSYNNHEPERLRKLLLHRAELEKLGGRMRERGLSCVPMKMYFKKGKVKIEIALVRGKKQHDKRDSIKARDSQRQVAAALKKNR